jgi:predicted SAM-dependent methyltransferase
MSAGASTGLMIEIGAGTKGRPGYLHVDSIAHEGVDVVDDGRYLRTFEPGVADEIYSRWFFEHVARHEVPAMLARWQEVLRPGGKIRLTTNNHEAHVRCLHTGEISFLEWSYLVYAVENKVGYSLFDVHKCAWTQELLDEALRASGLVDVHVRAEWECREEDGRLSCPGLIAEGFKPLDG